MSDTEFEVQVEFSGGLELLFSNQRCHNVKIPKIIPHQLTQDHSGPLQPGKPANIAYLIHYLRHNLLKERVELFVDGNNIRPGILVLINETDWELEGERNYTIKSNDEVVFISTLHGG